MQNINNNLSGFTVLLGYCLLYDAGPFRSINNNNNNNKDLRILKVSTIIKNIV
jgi:hypothetical protein